MNTQEESPEVEESMATPDDLLDEPEEQLRDRIVAVLCSIYDPEIPVNIYELGLIYEVIVEDISKVLVKMTLTSPACPVAGSLPGEVEEKILSIDQVKEARVELTWEPPWEPDMMSEEAKLELGFF
jgi:FeS assembly SUF system protein